MHYPFLEGIEWTSFKLIVSPATRSVLKLPLFAEAGDGHLDEVRAWARGTLRAILRIVGSGVSRYDVADLLSADGADRLEKCSGCQHLGFQV